MLTRREEPPGCIAAVPTTLVIVAVDEPNEIWEGRQGGIVTRTPKAELTAPKPGRVPSLLGDLMRTDVSR